MRSGNGCRVLAHVCAMKTAASVLFLLLAAGCGERSVEASEPALLAPDTAEQFSRTCALCHVDGTGGAPRVRDADAWAPRLAHGEDMLIEHTVHGYNEMPPLGYCMDCTGEDFRALIRFMAGAP
jgi:cytochrome c5